MNLNYFFSGIDTKAYEYMGVHKLGSDVEFYLWAPHADAVDVFMSRDDFRVFYPMEKVDGRGIWHRIIENCECIHSYRYRILHDGNYIEKSDPYAFYSELRPANASIMYDLDYFHFTDDEYMENRKISYEDPLNIYELHLNGFLHEEELTSYREIKEKLIPYVKTMGYTHIELMPVVEHPYDGSWGYQATGYFSPTSRYGTPYDLMDLVNECHLNHIGVLLDVSYVHFATDYFGLGNFDGEACYELNDPERSLSQWGSYNFDLSSGPVVSFLTSSASLFLDRFHFDGLRLDAVANLIYIEGNKDRGLNRSGISFIKRFNKMIRKEHLDVLLIAEDSTDYPDVTKPIAQGGLGFDYKWDLGWMNDTLRYYSIEPSRRKENHHLLTFSMYYFYSERFLLPLSHDEVVHGKGTIISKMWGSYEEKFSQCRNLFLYMFTHPGKKLNFLGNDMAMFREFDERRELDWNLLEYPMHDSFHRYFMDLCHLYLTYEAFHGPDYERSSFRWIDADNADESVYSYIRYDEKYCFIIVLNMRPARYSEYRLGVPFGGEYCELINSEKDIYSGCNLCNEKPVISERKTANGLANSIVFDLAPYAGIIFSTPLPEKLPPVCESGNHRKNAEC